MTKYKCKKCGKPLLSEGICIACKQKRIDKGRKTVIGITTTVGTIATATGVVYKKYPDAFKKAGTAIIKFVKK